jgi:hypothetical protein
VAAGFVAPGPEVVDPGGAGGGDGGMDVVGVLRPEAEALDPDLGFDAGGGGLLRHPFGEFGHERSHRLAERFPVGIGGQRGETRQAGDRRPVGHAEGSGGVGQQADGAAPTEAGDVGGQLTEELDQAAFAKGAHLGGEFTGHVGVAGLVAPPLHAAGAAAAPPLQGLVEVGGMGPVGLVPEDPVGSGLHRRRRPRPYELPVGRGVEAAGGHRPARVEDLAHVGMVGHEQALGLTAERAANPPGPDLHEQPGGMGDLDQPTDRVAVVREVVLAHRVEHAREAPGREVVHVGRHVPQDPVAEVRDADGHGLKSLP